MIVKIENSNKNGYSYYEGEEVYYECKRMNEISMNDYDVVDWEVDDCENPEGTTGIIIWVYSNERSNVRLIITNRVTYIMNLNGKTIERLR